MREATERRNDGTGMRRRATVLGIMVLSVVPSFRRLSAQVGYDPGRSPYRDIRRGAVGVLTFGYLSGGRGSLGVGLANGATAGIRYDVQFGAVGASIGLAYGRTTSFIVDPTKDSARTSGPYDNGVVLADAGLQLILTGRKTWRGFAPYIGGAIGIAGASTQARDTSGYKFGTKFTLSPNVGVRWYPARRLSIRGDFRLVLWKLQYPLSYKVPPQGGSSVLAPTASVTEWTSHRWGTIGVGWTF
jgi:hypothetical protein